MELNPDYNNARESLGPSFGAIVRWQPTDNSEIVPFFGWSAYKEHDERPIVFLAGPGAAAGVRAAQAAGSDLEHLGQRRLRLRTTRQRRARSRLDRTRRRVRFAQCAGRASYYENLYDAEPSGVAQYYIAAVPEQIVRVLLGRAASCQKVIVESARRHTVQLIARARDSSRLYGGDDERFIATTVIGVAPQVDKPDFSTTTRNSTDTLQQNAGVAYALQWRGVGELGLGLQRARVKRDSFDASDGSSVSSDDTTTLYNASAAVSVGPRFTIFASYSRGLEEAGIAPENATNRREAAPLILSEQVDAGVRYAITPGASALIGVFQIEKPWFGLSATNLFTELATVRHRGVEVSVAGEVARGPQRRGRLCLPRSAPVRTGRGRRYASDPVPVGPIPHVATLDISYGPARWNGFALEAAAEYHSSYVASQDNVLTVPSVTEIDLGFRYRFTVGKAPVSVRFQAMNVGDDRTWRVTSSGEARPTEGRRYSRERHDRSLGPADLASSLAMRPRFRQRGASRVPGAPSQPRAATVSVRGP